MQEFFKTLSQFSPGQLFLALAALTPFVGAVWVAMKWAYDTRLRNLETSLSDYRADFDRRLDREIAKVTDNHEAEIARLKTSLAAAQDAGAKAEASLNKNLAEEEVRDRAFRERKSGLERAEREFSDLFGEAFGLDELSVKAIDYLASNPNLLSKVLLSRAQVDGLQFRAGEGQHFAGYVLGRLLLTGRRLSDGMLPPNEIEARSLIAAAADAGYPPARSFTHGDAA